MKRDGETRDHRLMNGGDVIFQPILQRACRVDDNMRAANRALQVVDRGLRQIEDAPFDVG